MTAPTLPLLSDIALDAFISVGTRKVTTAGFIAQAEALAERLPDQPYFIHLADDRYHFLLGWVAACLRGQIMLLPPNQTSDTLRGIRAEYPRSHVFDDAVAAALIDAGVPAAPSAPDWFLPVDRQVAVVFTSGSTGRPRAHPKTWGSLFHNSRLAARDVLGGTARQVVATVPSQHMYGLEASLLVALTSACCSFDRRPFFPADVCAALAAMPEPRTLVTTPAHLRVLAAADLEVPHLDRVVSATAPLAVELAREVETRWNTEVFEIYGCTEAGVMAHRRTTRASSWHTLAGGRMVNLDGSTEYHAPQLPDPVPVPDLIECLDEHRFSLAGRAGDMIKVAGKRSSLQELTRQLLSVAGVKDAAVLVPDGKERPAAIVVAPGLSSTDVSAALRPIVDPVFLPRPLVVVRELPRNEVGKLPREALLRLLTPADNTGRIRIPADHPCLAGHFPGNPLVPGVVLLDAVLAHVSQRRPGAIGSIPSVKFLAPVRPEELVQLRVEFGESSAHFIGLRDDVPVFEGRLVFADGQPS